LEESSAKAGAEKRSRWKAGFSGWALIETRVTLAKALGLFLLHENHGLETSAGGSRDGGGGEDKPEE